MPSQAINFDNSYAQLPEGFFAKTSPTPSSDPKLLVMNAELAESLQIDPKWLSSDEGLEMLSGQKMPVGAQPLAMAYAGHQFGNFVPQLGDGRAILIGEVLDRNAERFDIQLKGGGLTPFSRGGDGKAALGPALREYIVSEAMYRLGIPTTRALAVVTTGDMVQREIPLPGAIITRVASSHIRVGTFQYFYARDDITSLRKLADYVVERHYPDAADGSNKYAQLLTCVVKKQAELIAHWMRVGFIHGVMNTDNTTVSGETIDYGPCAFMDVFDPKTVFSAIDQTGRYAYGQQPQIGQWNLSVFAQSMLPLLSEDQDKAVDLAKEALAHYPSAFQSAYERGVRDKMGLVLSKDGDIDLWQDLAKHLAVHEIDFTQFFRLFSDAKSEPSMADMKLYELFGGPSMFDMWLLAWRSRLREEERDDNARQAAMRAVNPIYIPRNHVVEEALDNAHNGDLSYANRLIEILQNPFEEQAGCERYARPPLPDEVVANTFCGT